MLLLAVLGCALDEEPATGSWPDPELPSCEVAEAEVEGEGGEGHATCVDRLVDDAACERASDSMTQEGLLFAGTPSAPSDWSRSGATFTVTDADTWAEVAAELGEGLPAVDFDDSLVVVVVDAIPSTCGAEIGEHGVSEGADGSQVVFVVFEDPSAACGWVCSSVHVLVVAYAVPRTEAFPRVCSAEIESCRH